MTRKKLLILLGSICLADSDSDSDSDPNADSHADSHANDRI